MPEDHSYTNIHHCLYQGTHSYSCENLSNVERRNVPNVFYTTAQDSNAVSLNRESEFLATAPLQLLHVLDNSLGFAVKKVLIYVE